MVLEQKYIIDEPLLKTLDTIIRGSGADPRKIGDLTNLSYLKRSGNFDRNHFLFLWSTEDMNPVAFVSGAIGIPYYATRTYAYLHHWFKGQKVVINDMFVIEAEHSHGLGTGMFNTVTQYVGNKIGQSFIVGTVALYKAWDFYEKRLGMKKSYINNEYEGHWKIIGG